MSAVLSADLVRVNDHRHRVPAQVRLDAPLKRTVTRIFGLAGRANRIEIRRVWAVRQVRAGASREIDHLVQQEVRPLRAMLSEYGVN